MEEQNLKFGFNITSWIIYGFFLLFLFLNLIFLHGGPAYWVFLIMATDMHIQVFALRLKWRKLAE